MSAAASLLVIWHSHTGATQAMAQAIAEAASAAVSVRCLPAQHAHAADVLAASAVVFATPETLGSMSGGLKDFFDRSYYALLDRCVGKACALVVCAGSDGAPTIAQLQRITTGLRLRQVADPLRVCTHAQTAQAIAAPKQLDAQALRAARELGTLLGEGLAMGVF